MAFSDVKCNSGSMMAAHISNPFSLSNGSRSNFLSPRVQSSQLRLPCPEFFIHRRTPYTVILDKVNLGNYQQFYTENDLHNHILMTKRPADFSHGVLPGDIIISINDVDIKQLSPEEVNEKFTSNGPNELKLILTPSEECLELSTRSIYLFDSHLGSLQDLLSTNNSNSNRICLRGWIKENGCFGGLSVLIKKIYVNIFRETSSNSNCLCSVGNMVLVTHRDGYSTGIVAELLPRGEYQIKLVPGKQILTVTSDDINRANPKEFEGMDDLILLPHLNEVALVYNLHARFLNSLPYTYVADFALIAFNPMRKLDIYNESVKHLFFNCRNRLDMPPHIYSVAQTIYARMEAEFLAREERSSTPGMNGNSSNVDSTPTFGRERISTASISAVKVPTQAVCLLGRSGSGKSVNTEHLIEYLLTPQSFQTSESLSQHINKANLTARKMRAVMCLLDAFTCSRTLLNSNASRCLRLFTIEFLVDWETKAPQISASGLNVDILLLDKFRVTRRPQGEPTFHIFYYFLAGLESDIRREYVLEDLTFPNLFMTPLQREKRTFLTSVHQMIRAIPVGDFKEAKYPTNEETGIWLLHSKYYQYCRLRHSPDDIQWPEDQALARSRWQAVHEAARALGGTFEEAFIGGVCRLLAAIYHLGCAGAIPPKTSPSSPKATTPVSNSPAAPRLFINHGAAERAARLLGCPSVEDLASEVFSTKNIDGANGGGSQSPSNLELLGGFVANLYATATNTLRDLINSFHLIDFYYAATKNT
ncbi:hypothetical protein ACTXT7_015770 [Hymenolepis weldensis]